jgi:hypothetical protein
MLVAKINPTGKLAKQDNPFEVSSIEASNIVVLARPYILGTTKEVAFEVAFGNVVVAEDGTKSFINLFSSEAVLTQEELGEWSDDLSVLDAVAVKLGTSIESSEVF